MSEVLLDRVVNVIEKNEDNEKNMITSLKEDYIVRAKAVAYIINANPEAEKDVDELIEKGEPKISAILEVIRRYIKVCKPIHFDGNGYSDEWKAEAARRGLDRETSVPVIFDNYLKPESIRMFESIGVMTKKELEKLIGEIQKKMQKAAADLNFEAAAELRDKMLELKKQLNDME